MYALFISAATIIVVILQIFNHYNLSKGNLKLAYKIAIIAYSLYAIIETCVALRNPEQISLLLFNIVNFWAIGMAVKGLLRLRKEENKHA